MPSSNSSLILPLVLWDHVAPECHIASMAIDENEKLIFTGTTSGHIIMWEFDIDEITPICLMIGHTGVVNCLANAGCSKDEEYLVSSSENGEMKLWEINERKCIENIKLANIVHRQIYSSKTNGKYTRLYCVGNYTGVLVMDPMSLDILYNLVSRDQHQWIRALCINSFANQLDEVVVGVSISGTIKLWTVNANEPKGAEIVEHEYKNCQCESACVLVSCPGKHRIFMAVCPKFFQIFDAVDFTVLCLVRIDSVLGADRGSASPEDALVTFTSGFFIDIDHVVVCTSDGNSYLYLLPDNVNPQSANFRQKVGRSNVEKLVTTRLIRKFTRNEPRPPLNGAAAKSGLLNFYGPPVFHVYELRKKQSQTHQPHSKFLLRGDCHGRLTIWNMDTSLPTSEPGAGSGVEVADNKNVYEMSLATFWKQNVRPEVESIGVISTFLYLPTIDKLVYGLLDGSIIIMPAIDFLVKHLFRRSRAAKPASYMKLKKHNSKVTCILYPHAEHSRYDPSFLVSGSLDFSVVLWNINTGDVIHKFVVQTGEILQLSIPPINVNPRILQCICSVASDHSVALLSLKECKPVMVASRHLFPILFVKWRPLDDYLIVKCTDGSVFVWQIETGSLDRVAHGLVAEDIINAADEAVAGGSNMIIGDASMGPATPSSSSMSLLQASTLSSATAAAVGVAVASSSMANSAAAASSGSSSGSSAVHKSHSVNNLAAVNLTTPIISTNKSIANQTLALGQLLQKRNFSNSVKLMAQKMATSRDEQKKNPSSFDSYSTSINFPLIMQTFHLNPKDPVNHLLLFDIDSLLTSLILEEHSIDSIVKLIKTNFFKDTHNVQTAQTQVITPLYRTTPDHSQSTLKRVASAKLFDAIDLKQLNMLKSKVGYAQSIIKITHILLSCLHLWSIDAELDQLFTDKLSLQKPKYPITFGQISRGAHLFVMFPPKRTYFTYNKAATETPSAMVKSGSLVLQNRLIHQKSINLIDFDEADEQQQQREYESQRAAFRVPPSKSRMSELARIDSVDENKSLVDLASPMSPPKDCYLSVKSLSTEHLLAILAIANSFMNLHNFIDLQIKQEDHDPIEFILSDHSSHSLPTETNNYGQSQAQITQAYSRLSTMYCMLADYYDNEMSVSFKSLNLETLALKWMDQSYEIREAAQALLKNELKRIGPNGRTQLVRAWDSFLTSLLKDFDDQVAQQQQQQLNPASLVQQQQQQTGADSQATLKDQQMGLDSANTQSNLNRIRRKQYVSIVLLSLIGAEFGQDVNTSTKNAPNQKTIPQGFSIEDHSILKRISTALTNFVTNKQLQHDINRRAAIDLMGRGFTIWEPFIQPTYVLLSLLELSADCEFYVPSLTINLPLIPVADLCRTARSALNLIANSKPKTFILTIAKEIKRVNAPSGQSGQGTQGSFPFSQALTRGKPEILAIIERLIENQSQDVFELLSDVIEIILFCLDPNQIRGSPLEELFPPLFRFPMVRYCRETKRIVCGCHNGRLVLYEYKTSKWNFQSYPAHNNQPIVAAAISTDSKYVASYSAHDNSLIFWQSSGGNIFNIGSNTLKQIKSCNAAPIEINVPSSRLASLSFQNRTLNLSYHDGRKFTYTI